MPIPLIIGAGMVLAAGYGAKKHLDANENAGKARRLVRDATDDFEQERENLQKQQKSLVAATEKLAKLRKQSEVVHMKRFRDAAANITSLNYREISVNAHLPANEIPTITDIGKDFSCWVDLPTSGAKGLALGLMGATSATSLATSIGVASTGTAISSLTGVAATNATLAWLGGGSLAAGGFGMAGGMAVLGGTVVGPLVAITGLVAAKNAEVALTKAYEKEAEIQIATEQVRDAQVAMTVIKDRVSELRSTITTFLPRFDQITSEIESVVCEKTEERGRRQQEAEELRAAYARVNIFIRFFNWLFGRVPCFDWIDPLDYKNFSKEEQLRVAMDAY